MLDLLLLLHHLLTLHCIYLRVVWRHDGAQKHRLSCLLAHLPTSPHPPPRVGPVLPVDY
jgi:hypothetical protein